MSNPRKLKATQGRPMQIDRCSPTLEQVLPGTTVVSDQHEMGQPSRSSGLPSKEKKPAFLSIAFSAIACALDHQRNPRTMAAMKCTVEFAFTGRTTGKRPNKQAVLAKTAGQSSFSLLVRSGKVVRAVHAKRYGGRIQRRTHWPRERVHVRLLVDRRFAALRTACSSLHPTSRNARPGRDTPVVPAMVTLT
ncbi:hypothetical protein P171DRAFT_74512 [Karstenula rhodostoma CBS 690.94]|uniref:Uncharacterized protein n=1 Tax=Karstenula rhodostoma CBS 690.94 TaxID=1392251 RepID=A0A9P4PEB5_9PLEO|nr:hypothetical protein P171DRAFT_74512 [Karstenula rhodostoma CBS 690.94]